VGEPLFPDGFFQEPLAGVGTHVFVIGGKGHAGEFADRGHNPLHIDRPGDVFTAMADKNAYSGHLQ
jgi:hypothetical protein